MRLRFWRRPDDRELVEMLHFVFADDENVLASHRIIDCSDLDVRLVADRQDEFWPHTVLRHPDLWFDGRWDDPDDWRNDPLLRKVKRDMHARVGAAPFLGGEFGRAMDEPFMPRLEALT